MNNYNNQRQQRQQQIIIPKRILTTTTTTTTSRYLLLNNNCALYSSIDDSNNNENDDIYQEDLEETKKKQSKNRRSRKKKKSSTKQSPVDDDNENDDDSNNKPSKEDLVRAVGERMKQQKQQQQQQDNTEEASSSVLDRINPFKAGQQLRKTIDTAFSKAITTSTKKSEYYLDDLLLDETGGSTSTTISYDDDYIPEVLVIGATGAVGRLVVRQLVLSKRCKVRVLVRDLYTKTLNMLGTGVTYCQGDLQNQDSLEYALTDVDKIIFCAASPKPDENEFQNKFLEYMQENNIIITNNNENNNDNIIDFEKYDKIIQLRSKLAKQVDYIGMSNLIKAYQHVRHADYGTSQAAKRTLFKFKSRNDFNLFTIDDGEYDTNSNTNTNQAKDEYDNNDADEYYEDDDDYYYDEDDYYYDDDNDNDKYNLEKRNDDELLRTQSQWIQNQFGHGVFVGRIPKESNNIKGGEAAIISSRLRSRENPKDGIELGPNTFAGFIARVCSDGGIYEAFIRTGSYNKYGIEYVCEFSTSTKISNNTNKSKNKFTTIRLPFENFKPVQRGNNDNSNMIDSIPTFRGQDIRYIGFRYRSSRNTDKQAAALSRLQKQKQNQPNQQQLLLDRFYLAFSYIKVYRAQPEPEFVYLSDARIPPIVKDSMVRHDTKQLLLHNANSNNNQDGVSIGQQQGQQQVVQTLLDESTISAMMTAGKDGGRSQEEIYYKYRGEEILKQSGLSYAIVRVAGYDEKSTISDASTIELRSDNTNLFNQDNNNNNNNEASSSSSSLLVSRADVAQICVKALLDPYALNKSFYISRKITGGSSSIKDEDISAKFRSLRIDEIA